MPAEALVSLMGGIRDVALAFTVGGLFALAAMLPVGHRAVARASAVARWSSIVWAISAVAFIFVSYAYISNQVPAPERFVEEVWTFATTIPLGQAYLQMALAAIVVSILAAFVRTPLAAAWTLAPVVWALGWQGLTGHAAGAQNHHLAVAAMFLHLAASAVWLGVIGMLLVMRGPLGDDAKVVVRRGSQIALWAAIAIIVSGFANAWVRLSSPADLVTTHYGRILILKVALMTLAIVLAAWHRRVSLPRLSDAQVRERFWRVMFVDVGALIAVVGVAVVLSGTEPPVPIEAVPEPSPAYFLTDYELPPPVSAVNWIALWRLDILLAFALASAGVMYLRWVQRLHRRGDTWPWHRTVMFLVGVAVMVWVTQGAPAIYGLVTFSGHMVQHMVLVMVAPVFLTLGAPVTLALRALPVRTDGSRGPREWLRALVESKFVGWLAHPIVAAVNFSGSLVVFYFTPIFEFALSNHAGHLWMVAHFTLAGYFFANALVGIDPGPRRSAYPIRIVLLFATMAFHAFFGVSLIGSDVLLAPRWYGLMGRDWGPDAISDQQYGGQIAWGIGELPVVLLAIGVITSWRKADNKEARRKDRQADRDEDAELKAYNEMLARAAAQEQESGR